MAKAESDIKLSILICHLPGRYGYLRRLYAILERQMVEGVECLVNDEMNLSIGAKRNSLLQRAKGKYVGFIDDDDRISEDYISLIMEGINNGADCCSLTGEITVNGIDPKPFIHSIDFDSYFERDGIYYRPPNHLNCIRSDIAKQFAFPEKNHGEDTDWAMKLCRSGFLKKEHKIEKTIYFYEFRSGK